MGAFVEFLPGKEGLVHVSRLADPDRLIMGVLTTW
jgi:predicted RNA-binding protein with RPS1 domain